MLPLGMSQANRCPFFALLAIVLAIVAACSDAAQPPGLSVQPAWQRARLSHGHQVHVVREHLACAKCHELDGSSIRAASPMRCAACHEKESAIRHAEAEAAQRFGDRVKADCTKCHAFSGNEPAPPLDGGAPSWAQAALDASPADAASPAAADAASPIADGGVPHGDFGARDCVRCHGTKQGNTPAIVVHASSRCVSCHRPHDDASPKPGDCSGCHKNIQTTHASLGKPAVQVCTTCHEHQHARASEAVGTCVTCHAKQQPIVPATALFAGGHTQCISCHKPHEFAKTAVQPCRTCHAQVHVLGETAVLAHNQCTNCHSPHDVRGSPENACQGCHANVHPEHPKIGGVHACTGCHDPHPAAGHLLDSVLKCSGCHQTAHSDKDFHQGLACTQCHAPHAFSLKQAGTSLCRKCHAQELSRVALRTGHQACSNCHSGLPHHPASLLASCGSCHATQQAEVKPGHAKCTNCHEPHSGAQGTPCQSCHQKEARSAPSGHTKCTNCHEPHTGSVAAAPACTSCHVTEGSSKHGGLAGGCTNCHQPHEGAKGQASPPACTTCHQPSSLLGLHQIAKHQDCKRCHTGHGDQPTLVREVCLTCHTDRKAHFPDAPRCANCHLFETRK
jgi:predicted CXXCH cytochrome family protein